jgi:hypothetical protein
VCFVVNRNKTNIFGVLKNTPFPIPTIEQQDPRPQKSITHSMYAACVRALFKKKKTA